MPQVDIGQRPETVFDEQGQGDPVVVMHGGLESAADWAFLADALGATHRVLRPDRPGHGRTADVDGPYRYPDLAERTARFVEAVVGGPAHLVGYSDGGTIALHLALDRPDLVRSLVLISANFHHDGLVPAMADRLRHPDPDNPRLDGIRQAYDDQSPDGVAHWPVVYRKVCEMGSTGPTLDEAAVSRIGAPALVVAADDDAIELGHIVQLYRALPDARLAVVPGTSHLLHHEAPDRLADLVVRFLAGDEPTRLMPMRRVPATVD